MGRIKPLPWLEPVLKNPCRHPTDPAHPVMALDGWRLRYFGHRQDGHRVTDPVGNRGLTRGEQILLFSVHDLAITSDGERRQRVYGRLVVEDVANLDLACG